MATEMKLITDITLELTGETKRYEVVAKQGDKATRFIRITLKNNGQDFEIPAGMKVIANIQKPDRKCCYNTCSYSGNKVTMELTNQALAVAGTAECDIEIRDANDEVVLSSQAFTIEIEKSMRDENAIRSSNEFTQLEQDVREYAAEYLEKNPVQPTPVDKTLTKDNEAADAKITGDAINSLDNKIKNICNDDGKIKHENIPVAESKKIGGIYADDKTPDDVLPVRIGEDGKLYAESPTPMLRFRNMTGSWGYFPNTSMQKDVDYSLSEGGIIDGEGLHLPETGNAFKTLSTKAEDITPKVGHKYWVVIYGDTNTYGAAYLRWQYQRNATYEYYDDIGQISLTYSGSGESNHISSKIMSWDSDKSKPGDGNGNKFILYANKSTGAYYFDPLVWVMIFDLTETFGKGNEPLAEELDALFDKIYGADKWNYISSKLTLEIGGDGSRKIENIIIPDGSEGGGSESGDNYLKGKSLYVIGDSLTDYSNWGKDLCEAEGMTWNNWGYAGTTMAAPETPNYETGKTGVERVRQLPSESDYVKENMIIIIWLGINDTNLGAGADETDIHTLYGGLNDVLNYLTTTFPKTPFGIMGLHKNSNKTVTATNEIMKQICEKYSVPFFDTEKEGRIIPSYLGDGLHLGANATANIRRRVRQWIKTL